LNLVTASANTLKAAKLKEPAAVSGPGAKPATDQDQLAFLLSELDDYLEQGQIKAAQFINVLRELLPGPEFSEPLERLEKYIDRYDFDEARGPVAEIAGLLDIVLER